MRLVALALPLLFLVPVALASQQHDHAYVNVIGQGCAGGGALIRHCETYFPHAEEISVTAEVQDVSGKSVRVRICHEWTYDDGSHPDVECLDGCSPHVTDKLHHPPWPSNTTYRVIVDLRNGPLWCEAAATAGTMRVTFS